MLMTLGEVASALNLSVKKDRSILLNSVSIDSRNIQTGALFFALRGERFDGHDFVAYALKNGAMAAVVEKPVPDVSNSILNGRILQVENSLRALQDLAAYYRRKFLFPVIAITGTNGKTTTKEMVAQVLSTHYQVMKTEGNFNNHIGLALSVFSWSRNGELAVAEMGTNHFGEIRRLCEIAAPTHGVITNIGKGHLQFFRDEAGVAKAKSELLESLSGKGLAFLNGDDVHLIPYRKTAGKTVTFGFSPECDLVGKHPNMDRFGFPRMEVEGQAIRLSLSGRHNLYNALAAIAVARIFGIPWGEIQEKLWRFRPVDGRTEVVRAAGVVVINDTYNANPSSVEQSLLALKDMIGLRRRIVVLGDMLELGESSRAEHDRIGESIAAGGFDCFFGTGPLMKQAVQTAKQAGLKQAEWFSSKSKLHPVLLSTLRGGDGVLVKGSRGMKMEDTVRKIQEQFRDEIRE